jgi:hypothetical protein
VSDDVIEHVMTALRLNDIEREHLLNLVSAASPSATSRPRTSTVTGSASPATPSAACARPPAGIPTIAR